MKKNLFVILSLFAFALVWCTTNNQVTEIDSQNGEQLFNSQVDNFQYIKDLEDFVSYDVLSITEDKPYSSDWFLTASFDKNSSLQWWVDFSWKSFSKTHNLESSDVEFSVKAENSEKDTEPFDLSWSASLLYKDGEMYLNLHNLDVFMWEWNMVAKMYTLLWNMVIDNWVDLEVHSGWVIEVDENDNKRLPYIVWSFKNILKTENIESNPDFLDGVVEVLDTVNSRIDLWISTNELKMINREIWYSELWDKSIQKEFTWSFQWKESAFDLSFVASKNWLEVYLYNIREYDEEISDYKDVETEFEFILKEKSKSEYSVDFESSKLQKKIVDLEWEIKYGNEVKFSADFVTEPIELIQWQKLSWKLKWSITKKSWELDREIPEITGEILSVTELLSSL